jgi:hypothetical protein
MRFFPGLALFAKKSRHTLGDAHRTDAWTVGFTASHEPASVRPTGRNLWLFAALGFVWSERRVDAWRASGLNQETGTILAEKGIFSRARVWPRGLMQLTLISSILLVKNGKPVRVKLF